ncbi:MAG: hypothetical protein M1813_004004 [Trichoglossum hirsutum]|nr:MAG: hypothetical protein M1813_004004 [Trichoglossum hirsutum]
MDIQAISISPGSRMVAAGVQSCITQLWDKTGFDVLRLNHHSFPEKPFRWVTFSSDGRRLANGSTHVRILDLTTGSLIQVLEGKNPDPEDTVPAAFSKDGNVIATSDFESRFLADDDLVAWSFDDNCCIEDKWKPCSPEMSMPSDIVYTLGFSYDGQHLVSGAGHKDHGNVAVWDTSTRRLVQLITRLGGALRYSKDGKLLMMGPANGTVEVRDV